ncbi:MAG: hypothetical protein CBB67_016495 [Alteromonadaceae bacterium TMED7]|nr:MAG: hypothetical protein CBB67_016495 [Alteromonadaceae bacterium TMED7]
MDENQKIIKGYQHIGWIPCVLGSLDFSRVNTKQLCTELSEPHTKSQCFSYINEHSIPTTGHRTRCNLVSSIYDWKDRRDEKNEYDGLFRFITFGETQSDGSLIGEAFLVLHDDIKQVANFPKEVLEPMNALEQEVLSYQQALKENQYSPSVELDLGEVQKKIERIKVAIKHIANNELLERVFNIKYRILSNGLTLLRTEDWLGQSNSPEYKNAIERTKYIADKQCFIYLKYSLHRHKHHNGQEDRLTSVHRINEEAPSQTALKLVEDLNRSIIEIKEREIENLDSPDHHLQGFISYAKSLLNSLELTKLLSEEEAGNKRQYLDNMFGSWMSVASRSEKRKAQKQDKEEKDSKGIVEFFQAISILVATLSLIIHTSFRFFTTEGADVLINGTIYENVSLYISSSTKILDVLAILFLLVVLMVSGWIIWQPHGIVRRPIRWARRDFGKKAMFILRSVLIALLIFTIGVSIPS